MVLDLSKRVPSPASLKGKYHNYITTRAYAGCTVVVVDVGDGVGFSVINHSMALGDPSRMIFFKEEAPETLTNEWIDATIGKIIMIMQARRRKT